MREKRRDRLRKMRKKKHNFGTEGKGAGKKGRDERKARLGREREREKGGGKEKNGALSIFWICFLVVLILGVILS